MEGAIIHSQDADDDAVVPQHMPRPRGRMGKGEISRALARLRNPQRAERLATLITSALTSSLYVDHVVRWMRWFMIGWTIRDIACVLKKINVPDEQLEAQVIVGVTADWSPAHIAELVVFLFNRHLLPEGGCRQRNPRTLLSQCSDQVLLEIVNYSKAVIARFEPSIEVENSECLA